LSPQDRERLDAISQALANLVRRQREMEERLARVEHSLAAAGWLRQAVESPPLPPPPVPRVEEPVPPRPSPPPYPVVEPEPVTAGAPPQREEPRGGLEGVFGLTWISRIGALTLIIGVGFFFKYAFENRWITETGRVFLGVAVAAAALAMGERLWSKGQGAYAQSLTAAGIAFLFLAFWAAFGLYHLLGSTSTLALMTATTVGAVLLALRYRAAPIAALGFAGGFLTPLLLETGRDPWFVLGYALLLAGGAFLLAPRWPRLQILSAFGTAMLYATQWANPIPSAERLGFTVFTLTFYAIFAAGPVAGVSLAAQLLAGVVAAGIWEPRGTGLIPVLIAGAAGLAIADRRDSRWHAAASFAGLWLAYGSWSLWVGSKHGVWGPFAFITGAFLLLTAWPLIRSLVRGLPLRAADLALTVLNAAFYFAAGYALLEPAHKEWAGLFAVAVALVEMSVAALLWDRERRGAILSAGAAWVLLGLAIPIQFTGYTVAIGWSLEGAALAWTGSRLNDRRASYAALLVFAAALVRLLAVDSWMFPTVNYTPLFNARFLAFAAGAAALWAAAFWTRDRQAAAAAYLAGHFALLWSLCLEVSGWAARSASAQNVANTQSLAISILIACYAVLLVAAGVARRFPLDRVAGISLIGFVVVKLYLYDVWQLPLFYRMAAFGALGVLLLATSYLYSRFRDVIGGWLRPDEPATSLPSSPEARR
jgi:uncharacterized membrane protein